MANPSTLYRFRIDLTDVDRGVYEHLDVRTPMHPSEAPVFLVTRMLAYALNFAEGIQFSKLGLSEPEDPCISVKDADGAIQLWIEIGNPSAKKTHKATKASPRVRIYTYKNAELLIAELLDGKIYQPERIEIFSFPDEMLEFLCERLERDTSWNLIHQENGLILQIGDESVEGEVLRHHLS